MVTSKKQTASKLLASASLAPEKKSQVLFNYGGVLDPDCIGAALRVMLPKMHGSLSSISGRAVLWVCLDAPRRRNGSRGQAPNHVPYTFVYCLLFCNLSCAGICDMDTCVLFIPIVLVFFSFFSFFESRTKCTKLAGRSSCRVDLVNRLSVTSGFRSACNTTSKCSVLRQISAISLLKNCLNVATHAFSHIKSPR